MTGASTPQDQESDDVMSGEKPQGGVGLCLSGGGYRAMLFHVGALWRLVEAGKLKSIDRISSVSGGSITSGVLALAWDKLADGDISSFKAHVVDPLRAFAGKTIDRWSILGGVAITGNVGASVSDAYDKHLFGGSTLQNLPDEPRFIFNATNMETGSLFRFSKRHNSDYSIGQIATPTTAIADAVAASSAFPPFLSPFMLEVDPEDFTTCDGDLDDDYRQELSLTDGGVYDNLGLQQVWGRCKTVLVSDGGGRLAPDPTPASDWGRQLKRILDIVDHQVRNLRKRQIVGSLASGEREGAYWGIRTDIEEYQMADALACPHEATMRIADIPTRLKRLGTADQERLINWGYAVTDAALRRYFDQAISRPVGFPYPDRGVG